ncbi:hypothetical protein MNBD_UNCLBAC01-1486 [hydrothermal vent metagenome]|uniref:DUF2059 domain-containing protein n=1 Tax=hydrothermal vent metagenome TaxID=652676 RepID=A0A3B1D6C6_9ZZZZ
MSIRQHLVKFWIVLFLGIMSVCSVEAQEKEGLLDDLIKKSGMYEQISQLPAYVQAGMVQQQAAGISVEKSEVVSRILMEVFQPDILRKDVKNYLKDALEVNDIQEVLVWLDSSLGMKITKLEEQASTPEAMGEMQQQAEQLYTQTERVEIVSRLDEAIKATDAMVQMIENMGIAAAIAAMSASEQESEMSQDEVVSMVKQGVTQYYDMYKNITIVSFLYSYQILSDEELMEYIQFAESNIGKKYHKAGIEALNIAVKNASKKIGELMVKEFEAGVDE